MSRLRETLSQTWLSIQISLFPWLSEELGPLTKKVARVGVNIRVDTH
jgi:hypothetical protein